MDHTFVPGAYQVAWTTYPTASGKHLPCPAPPASALFLQCTAAALVCPRLVDL